jgi:hypothetical protein
METGPKEPPLDLEPQRSELYHFPGVTVIVPEQFGDQIMAISKDLLKPKTFPNNNQFTFFRQIANIVLVKKEGYELGGSYVIVNSFDPPIELRVGYNIDDLMKAGCDIYGLKLAYWNGADWVILSNDIYKYMILPPSTAQVAEVTIHEWSGDPPLAWGG